MTLPGNERFIKKRWKICNSNPGLTQTCKEACVAMVPGTLYNIDGVLFDMNKPAVTVA
jgi:hypothetical protein